MVYDKIFNNIDNNNYDQWGLMLKRLHKMKKYGFKICDEYNNKKIFIPESCNNHLHCENQDNDPCNIYFPYYSNANENVYICSSCEKVHIIKNKLNIINNTPCDIKIVCQK